MRRILARSGQPTGLTVSLRVAALALTAASASLLAPSLNAADTIPVGAAAGSASSTPATAAAPGLSAGAQKATEQNPARTTNKEGGSETAVRNVVVQAEKFDHAAGGRVTVQADVQCAAGTPRSLTVVVPAPGATGKTTPPLVRATPLRLNTKTGLYEATLTIPPAQGAVDLPVDEAKLPEIAKLNYRMDPNSMVGKHNKAKADSLYTGEFFNKFIEITTPAGRKKIYFSALVNAKFASDGSATVLTVDNRTLTGRLESRFTYQVGGASMKWTCGAEQITYVEVPNAKAADKKIELKFQITGTAADGTPIAPSETILK